MTQFDNFYANARRSENDGSYYQRLSQPPLTKVNGL